jgi:hypothetical protein
MNRSSDEPIRARPRDRDIAALSPQFFFQPAATPSVRTTVPQSRKLSHI